MRLQTIGLDAGHGGPDKDDGASFASGCAMILGFSEDDWTLQFSTRLAQTLAAAGFAVKQSRVNDALLSRDARKQALAGADLILSLHVNTVTHAPKASGLITFRWPGNRKSFRAAQHIHEHTPPMLLRRRYRDFAVSAQDWTRRAHRVVATFRESCVLIECGFASNPQDLRYLLSDAGQRALAGGLTRAMLSLRTELG